MANHKLCPMCGAAAPTVREFHEVPAGKRTVAIEDEFHRCSSCGEEFYTSNQADESFRRATSALRAKLGRVSPEAIKAFRMFHGLTQAQLEDILGTARKTVVRWERGTVLPSRAPSNLLQRLIANPALAADYLQSSAQTQASQPTIIWQGETQAFQATMDPIPASPVLDSAIWASAAFPAIHTQLDVEISMPAMQAANEQMALAA